MQKKTVADVATTRKGFVDPETGYLYEIDPDKPDDLHEVLARGICKDLGYEWNLSAEDVLMEKGWIKISNYAPEVFRYIGVYSRRLRKKSIRESVEYISMLLNIRIEEY